MQRLLRSIWDEPRPPLPSPPVWRDWVLMAVVVVAGVLEGVLRPDLPMRAAAMIVTLAWVPLLWWRRTHPLLVLATAFIASSLVPVVLAGPPPEMYTTVYLLILPYSLLRWASGREIVIGVAILAGKISLWMALGYVSLGDTIGGFAVVFAVCALGAALRYRAGVRARTLEQVKLLERERLARDLHDIVAHHVSAIAIRAQAGIAISAVQPEAAVNALEVIEAEASRALKEMRSMVRVLRRDEPAELAPAPGISDVEQLASRPQAGLPVEVEVSGNIDGLAPSVGTAIYHLAQESVTNARRHARQATRISVRVALDERSVRLRVSDDGDFVPARGSTGFGLIGMMERANLLGGTCEAGPNSGRGWTVTAVLPRNGMAA